MHILIIRTPQYVLDVKKEKKVYIFYFLEKFFYFFLLFIYNKK